MVNLTAIRDHVVSMLNAGLSKDLTYHNSAHTLDVAAQCEAIAGAEGITDQQILFELQVAALYHDTGFMYTYNKHEEKGCEIACRELPGWGIDQKPIDNICRLIMATKVPHSPGDHLQKIICDADLDYLGRKDFFEISNRLRLELINYKLISSEQDWEDRQLNFLQTHRYFTKTSREKRGPAKMEFIRALTGIEIKNQQNNL